MKSLLMSAEEERALRQEMAVDRATASNADFRAGAHLGLTARDRNEARRLAATGQGYPIGLCMRMAWQIRHGVVPEVVRGETETGGTP